MTPDPVPSAAPTSRRRLWWTLGIGAVVVALGVASLTLGATDPEVGGPRAGGQRAEGEAPPIELVRLDDAGTVSLAALRGQPVVVNFFASWCAPCRRELPAFRAVAERFGGRVAFLGVNHQDNRSGGLAMAEEFRLPYPSGYDPRGEVAVAYGLLGMPSTVFVSADGQLLEKHGGELSEAQLEAAIARLFGIGA